MYLCHRTHENQIKITDRCLALGTHAGFKTGMHGTVVEIFKGGIVVEWEDKTREDLLRREFEKYLSFEFYRIPDHIGELCKNCKTLITDEGCDCKKAYSK